jgi:hypothetical protein
LASAAVKKRRLKLVEVVWQDIASYGPQWHSESEVDGMDHVTCRSVGYLWSETKAKLKLVDTVTDDGGLGNVNVILKGIVESIRTLDTITVELPRGETPDS